MLQGYLTLANSIRAKKLLKYFPGNFEKLMWNSDIS